MSSKRKVDESLWDKVFGGAPPAIAGLKEFTTRHLTIGTSEHKEFEASTTSEDRDTLAALRLMRRAATLPPGDGASDLYAATRRLIQNYPKGLDARVVFSQNPPKILKEYTGLLNAALSRARARLFITAKGMTPQVNILCRDMTGAAFAYAAFGGLEVCPGCGNAFAPNPLRTAQAYCSKNCGQRIYQRAFRQRRKSKKSKSKGRNK